MNGSGIRIGGLTAAGQYLSPLVFDLWADRLRRRNAKGDVVIVRYADDIVIGFERETDALSSQEAMSKRLGEFALTRHPDKTRLFEFGRYAAIRRARRGLGKPEIFTFLGFTFICGESRQGHFLLHRKFRRYRLRATLREIEEGLRKRMHHAILKQGDYLHRVVSGFFNCHAVPTNSMALNAFLFHVSPLWLGALRRRSQRARLTRERMNRLLAYWLPKPRILHPGLTSDSPWRTLSMRMRPGRFSGAGARWAAIVAAL